MRVALPPTAIGAEEESHFHAALFVLYAESLMENTGARESGFSAHGCRAPRKTSARSGCSSAHSRRCWAPRVRSHRRVRKSGTEHVSGSGMRWVSRGAERRCDRALCAPQRAAHAALQYAVSSAAQPSPGRVCHSALIFI
jgi:hypothetical protein